MEINEQILFEIISENVQKLNCELEIVNETGIFFAPELFIAFLLGKEITKNQELIFNNNNIIWDREIDLGNGGPSDIVLYQLINNERKLGAVFEFKLRDTIDAYKADIEKLLRLERPGLNKYFCVLLDSFTESNDDRLVKLEKEYKENLKRIGQTSFCTKQNWYKSQVYCVLNLYEVLN